MVGMILAAGLGTRLKPFTDHHPKALARVNEKSVLQRNVLYLQQAGITRVVVNVHHFAAQIIEEIEQSGGWGSDIIISDESEAILETGGGVQKAVPLFGTAADILVMNADILTDLPLSQLIETHFRAGAHATLAVTGRESSRSLLFNAENRLCGWSNVKTGETIIAVQDEPLIPRAFSGIQVMNEQIFRQMPLTGKFSLIDAYLAMCSTRKIISFDHSGSLFMDIGTPEKLAAAAKFFP